MTESYEDISASLREIKALQVTALQHMNDLRKEMLENNQAIYEKLLYLQNDIKGTHKALSDVMDLLYAIPR